MWQTDVRHTDRRQTATASPGLVALYDIRPGNGAGLFLQPQSPHGGDVTWKLNQITSVKFLPRHTVVTSEVLKDLPRVAASNWTGDQLIGSPAPYSPAAKWSPENTGQLCKNEIQNPDEPVKVTKVKVAHFI